MKLHVFLLFFIINLNVTVEGADGVYNPHTSANTVVDKKPTIASLNANIIHIYTNSATYHEAKYTCNQIYNDKIDLARKEINEKLLVASDDYAKEKLRVVRDCKLDLLRCIKNIKLSLLKFEQNYRENQKNPSNHYYRLLVSNIMVKKRLTRSNKLDIYYIIEKNKKEIFRSSTYFNMKNISPKDFLIITYNHKLDKLKLKVFDKDFFTEKSFSFTKGKIPLLGDDLLDIYDISPKASVVQTLPSGKNTVCTIAFKEEPLNERQCVLFTGRKNRYGNYFVLHGNELALVENVKINQFSKRAEVPIYSPPKISLSRQMKLTTHLCKYFHENEARINKAISNLLDTKYISLHKIIMGKAHNGILTALNGFIQWYNEAVEQDMDFMFYLLPPSPISDSIKPKFEQYSSSSEYWNGVKINRNPSTEHPGAYLELRSFPRSISYRGLGNFRISQQAIYVMKNNQLHLSTLADTGASGTTLFTPGTPDFFYFHSKIDDFKLLNKGLHSHSEFDLKPWLYAKVLDKIFSILYENKGYNEFRNYYINISPPNRSWNDLISGREYIEYKQYNISN